VIVWILAWLVVPDQGSGVPAVARLLGGADFGLVLLALAAAVSVAGGLWQRLHGKGTRIALAVNLLLVAAALPAYAGLADWLVGQGEAAPAYVETSVTPGLVRDGTPIENIYPYSRDGRLLLDVLLYDQNGAPLDVRMLDSDPTRRVLRTREGEMLFNAFPVRYYEPGTRRVTRPGAAPPIDWSPVVTPPLRRKPATKP
jgi:hypothetical protein